MTLSRALISAHSGLSSASTRAGITSNNIANALTPGYVRRDAYSTESIVGGQGNGVGVTLTRRAQDVMLSRSRRDAGSDLYLTQTMSDAMSRLNIAIGHPGDDNGLFASISGLETAFRDLMNSPESIAYQQGVFSAVQDTVSTLNQLGELSLSIRQQADQDIAYAVQQVNSDLHRIHQFNNDIGALNEDDGSAAALEDERQRLIDNVAKYIPIKDIERDNGQIDILTKNGVFLLAGSVREIQFQPAGYFDETHVYGETGSALSGLFIGDQDITPNQESGRGIDSGELAGLFTIRDVITPGFSNQLDLFAQDLISRFSADTVDPTLPSGDQGIFIDIRQSLGTRQTAGTARHLNINAVLDPQQGGEVRRFRDGLGSTSAGPVGNADIIAASLQALTSTNPVPADSNLSGHFSTTDYAATLTSQVGTQSLRYETLTSGNLSRFQVLADTELSKIGVDTDLEMQQLLLIEQAYAANARVIQTVSDMIDQLMQI